MKFIQKKHIVRICKGLGEDLIQRRATTTRPILCSDATDPINCLFSKLLQGK